MTTNLFRTALFGSLVALSALSGCESIEQDDFVSRGGISPDPTAIIEGTVAYSGPRPSCIFEGEKPVRVVGFVVLNLYAYANGPTPEGAAANAVNQMVLPGDRIFDLSHCTTTDARVSSSGPFVWSRLALATAGVDYQIRAFYDSGEDFNPLFGVLRGPTVGDVLGSARADVTDPTKALAKINLPAVGDWPNGVVRRGVTVVLDETITTERPAFRLGDERRLAADAAFVPDEDPIDSLRRFRALTCSDPARGNGVNCGLSISLLPRSDGPKLEGSKVRLAQSDARAYSLYVDGVDLTTVVNEDIDRPGADGKLDPHPVLGTTLGIDWYAPMLTFTRRRTETEGLAGIPQVRFVGSLLLDDLSPALGTNLGSGPVPVVVPPMALVEWAPLPPSTSVCRVPYVAPRTPAAVTAGRLAHCGELPTGSYDVTLIAGSSNGLPGGGPAVRPSYQSWSLPNELGDVGDPPRVRPQVSDELRIASQGVDALFQVVDPPAEPSRASCEAQQGTICPGATLPVVEPEPGRGFDSPTCLPRACCDAIQHLCGLPLCGREPLAAAAGSPSKIGAPGAASLEPADSTQPTKPRKPGCVPFDMPRQCCDRAAR